MISKIENVEQLSSLKEEYLRHLATFRYQVLVCGGAGCVSSHCQEIVAALQESLVEERISDDVLVTVTGCMGLCAVGPVILVLPERTFYTNLTPEKTKAIVKSHLKEQKILEEYTFFDASLERHVPCMDDIEFYKAQLKIVLDNCGQIDFNDIKAYIARDGYLALASALKQQTPQSIINEVKTSGLRGRGGAGFPTGIKWQAGHDQLGEQKYMVCNADEGDPGAFMDRSIIEGDPHAVIEGMALGGYAIGANKGYVYIRAEYPIAIERLTEAMKQAKQMGLLGDHIFGSNFSFALEIRIGAGAFVCGEETALMASIEGKRGEPRQKPPFPFRSGLFGKPTIINNVETIANIPKILRRGGAWYAGFGLPKATGTKVFALAGQVVNTGIIEVPIGTSIGDIVYKIGGGIRDGKAFKAVQIGGPSGGCVTKEALNTPADYEALSQLGAIMGSGGLIVMNEDTCMVDTARFFMDFIRDESCGKCAACRIGTKRMLEILENITEGRGKIGDIELLEEIGETLKQTALCGLGQTAANPILSTIRYFREEYEEHILQKYCHAGVCASLFISPCENTCPANVNVPGYVALVASGRFLDAYRLIMQENPLPAICGRICTRPCEQKCRRGTVDEAVAIRDLKRFVADYAFKHETSNMLQWTAPRNGRRIAIIGAGASGLTCGYYLVRLGYDVDIFEAEQIAGGVLAYGIPEYRLPKDVLSHEIDLIVKAGVKIKYGVEIGRDIDFKTLQDQYDSVYVATGTQYPQKVQIPGEELDGVIHGIRFLKNVHFQKIKRLTGTVAVIGGGNTAIDSARTAVRLGASRVVIVYRRTIDAMPAYHEEVVEALEEGIEIMELAAPVKIWGDHRARVRELEMVRMELGAFDASGRRKSVEVKGSRFRLEVTTVIPAVSQYADLPFVGKQEVQRTAWGTFVIDAETQMTSMPGVFAGGDVARGPDDVIRAIADGKRAAMAMDKYLGGKGILNKGEPIEIPEIVDSDEIVFHTQFEKEVLVPERRVKSFEEVVKGYHKINAIAEAMRCLHCDRRAL